MSSKRDKHTKASKSFSSVRKAVAVKSKSSRSLPTKVSSSIKTKKKSTKEEEPSRRHRHHHRVVRSPSPSSEDSASDSESEHEEERRPSRHHHRKSGHRRDDEDDSSRRHRHRRSSRRSESGSDETEEEEEELVMPRRTRQTRVQKGPTPAEARQNAAVASAVAAALSASGGGQSGQNPVQPPQQAPIPAAVALSKSVTDEAIRASVADTPVAAPESAGSQEVHDAVKEAGQADTVNSAELATVLEEDKPSSGKNKHGSGSGVDYAAAYGELFTCLSTRMVDRIYRYFQDLYDVKCHRNEAVFKKQLSLIPSWNQAQIVEKTRELVKRHPSIVSYFKFAYAANVLLMSVVVQRDEESEDVSVDVPKFTEFVHRSYSESALKIFDYAGVFDPTLPPGERLSIRNELYRCFGDALSTSLRIMVPLEKIAPGAIDKDGAGGDGGGSEFEDMMRGDVNEEEEEEEEEEEVEEEKPRSKKHKKVVVEETEDEDDSDSDEIDSEDDSDNSGSEEDSDEESDEESEDFSSSEDELIEDMHPRRQRKHKVAAPRDTLAFF